MLGFRGVVLTDNDENDTFRHLAVFGESCNLLCDGLRHHAGRSCLRNLNVSRLSLGFVDVDSPRTATLEWDNASGRPRFAGSPGSLRLCRIRRRCAQDGDSASAMPTTIYKSIDILPVGLAIEPSHVCRLITVRRVRVGDRQLCVDA